MKTNQILTRKMGDFDVLQRTSDGMFNATALLKQWNEYSGLKKDVAHYFENSSTKEFINALISEENFNSRNSVYLKSRGKYNGGTRMHPLLFIDFAMWLNPSFKIKVLRFVYDQLIEYRNEAGNAYKEMTSSLSKIVERSFLPTAIQNIAKAINHIVFGIHQSDIRNKQAEESKMKELFELERDVSKAINRGLIKNYNSLVEYLRDVWREKWLPKELTT